ncbi:DNA glycosylase [Penicillium herquei]|nr:DNA glycosylase [Penicillium herquei]
MSLRRSARLGAIPSIKPPLPSSPVKVTRVQNNSVTKPRKAITKKTAPQTTKAPAKPTSSYWSPEPPTTNDSTQKLPENSVTTDTPNNRPHTPPPLDRPVDPHRTNVTLLTPHGSSVSAYPPRTEDASPSKTGLPRLAATTGTLLEKGLEHLIATDPRLRTVIELHPCPLFSPEGLAEKVDPFNSLTSSIIGQQVSGAAAKSIRNKFLALFSLENSVAENGRSKFPLPEEVARCDIVTLRTAGLSQRKAEYIQGLAEKFANGELSAQMLARASDEELVEMLIAVRGLGKWSVEMFACFALKRIDVFSTGDLGVQRGCAAFMGRDVSKMKGKGGGKFKYMAEKDMLELAAKYAPYRSLFMWYMWRIENVDVAVLTG